MSSKKKNTLETKSVWKYFIKQKQVKVDTVIKNKQINQDINKNDQFSNWLFVNICPESMFVLEITS